MRRKSLWILWAVPLLIGQMCGAPAPQAPQCMSMDEVIGMPAGNATGTGLSGTYRVVSAVVESCEECSMNSVPDIYCTAPQIEEMTLQVTQNDGVLTIDHPDVLMTGGVDADGSFEIGGVGTPTRDDGVKTGQALITMQGYFTGPMLIADMRGRLTVQDAQGRTLDLEQTISMTAARDQPE